MPPRDPEREREKAARELQRIGRELPDDVQGVEGSDVGDIVRHKNGKEDEEARIARRLADPHADAEQEAIDEMHLAEEE